MRAKTKFPLRTVMHPSATPHERLVCRLIEDAIADMRAWRRVRHVDTRVWRPVAAACWLLDDGRQWVETLPPAAADLVFAEARDVLRQALDAGITGIVPMGDGRCIVTGENTGKKK